MFVSKIVEDSGFPRNSQFIESFFLSQKIFQLHAIARVVYSGLIPILKKKFLPEDVDTKTSF